MLKIIIGIVVLLALLSGGYYFYATTQKTSSSETPKASGKVMTVGRYYWPDMYWVEIADKKGFFKEAGLNVELVDTNPDYNKSLQDIADGNLDTQNFYLYDLVSFNAKGANIVMVINDGQSTGGDGIVAKKDIPDAKALKGKKVALAKNTNSEYLMQVYLEKNNMNLADVEVVEIAPEKALEEFNEGRVDAFVSFEPYLTEAVEKSGGIVLFDTSAMPGVSPLGYSFRKEFIDERPEDVQIFVNVWHKTTEFLKENPRESFEIIAQINSVLASEVEAFLEDDKILDLDDNMTTFSYAPGVESLHGSARQINNFLIDNGQTDKQLDTTKFLEPKFVRALQQSLD